MALWQKQYAFAAPPSLTGTCAALQEAFSLQRSRQRAHLLLLEQLVIGQLQVGRLPLRGESTRHRGVPLLRDALSLLLLQRQRARQITLQGGVRLPRLIQLLRQGLYFSRALCSAKGRNERAVLTLSLSLQYKLLVQPLF